MLNAVSVQRCISLVLTFSDCPVLSMILFYISCLQSIRIYLFYAYLIIDVYDRAAVL